MRWAFISAVLTPACDVAAVSRSSSGVDADDDDEGESEPSPAAAIACCTGLQIQHTVQYTISSKQSNIVACIKLNVAVSA